MTDFLNKIIGDKKEWKAMEARAAALPHDYRVVYGEIKNYIWKSTGLGAIDVFKGILDLFEESAANSQKALAVTGKDVASFCDELVKDKQTYGDDWRDKLNSDIAKKLGDNN